MPLISENTISETERYERVVERNCPACGHPSSQFASGVCLRCKRNFEASAGRERKRELDPVRPLPSQSHWSDQGERIVTTDEEEGDMVFINELCQDYGVNQNSMIEIVARVEAREKPVAEASYKDVSELVVRFVSALSNALLYPGDKSAYMRGILLVMGFTDAAGGTGIVEVARACSTKTRKMSKQAFAKIVHKVEQAVNLPQFKPLPPFRDCRTDESKAKMSSAMSESWRNGK
jgi:hypothetical protein